MRSLLMLIPLITILASGCASVDTVKEAKGQGTKRVYPYSYELVFNATLAAAAKQKLDVIESDKSKQMIVLK